MPSNEHEVSLLSELFHQSRQFKDSDEYLEFLDFVVRMRNFAPFNAALLRLQKPGLRFAASRADWLHKFNVQVKPGARPLLIMWPFGPVALVFDVKDTNKGVIPDFAMSAFRAEGKITSRFLKSLEVKLKGSFIELIFAEFGDGLGGNIGRVNPVYVAKDKKEKSHYRILINASNDPNVQFATLAHELGHLFLGHLGYDPKLNVGKAPRPSHRYREIEAESVSYIVCNRNDVKPRSDSYLSSFVEANSLEILDVHKILKAAGKVEELLGLQPHMSMKDSQQDV